ncbi:MAG: amidohydrolase family protein [Saprospiraceae bacterium]|nr:amidohydrolase family protein [Saprospiraceae bacterium]
MQGRRTTITILLLAALGGSAYGQTTAICALHIRDALIIDGTGNPAVTGDICILGDTIARVDTRQQRERHTPAIDARGLIVAPGFIDLHAHGDPLATPDFPNFLAMGVTTVCLGQDGSSVPVDQMQEWLAQVRAVTPGVNIVPFAGHGTMRRVVGDAPDASGITRLCAQVDAAMRLGCYGVSMGLEYVPGRSATPEELRAVAGRVGAAGGLIMSHIRNEDDDQLRESLNEMRALADSCRVHIAHLKSVYGRGVERADEIAAMLAADPGMTADMYPYTASYTGIGILFPPWAKTRSAFEKALIERREELRQYLIDRVERRNGPEATLFGTAPFTGMTLAEVAGAADRHYADVLLDLGPQSVSGAYFIMDSVLQDRLFLHDRVAVSSDGSPTMHHPRGYGTFARVLDRYVRKQQVLSWEEAIHKMSGRSAQILGLTHRGVVRAGNYADLSLIDPATVRDRATYATPHVPAEGVVMTIVNGQIAFREGEGVQGRAGRVLLRATSRTGGQ